MRFILLVILFLNAGCATKYILPGNRFITPETQGGTFNSQIELQNTSANQLQADLSNANPKDGVLYEKTTRTGFLLSTSIFDPFDLIWSHTGSGNTLLGAKIQILGASRTAKGAGHKAAIGAAIGGNKHDSEDTVKVDFEVSGKELFALYGFRYNEYFLLYSNFTYSQFDFSGEVSSRDPAVNGLDLDYNTKIMAGYLGTEISYSSFFIKLESGYQQLATSDTKKKGQIHYGFSAGVSW